MGNHCCSGTTRDVVEASTMSLDDWREAAESSCKLELLAVSRTVGEEEKKDEKREKIRNRIEVFATSEELEVGEDGDGITSKSLSSCADDIAPRELAKQGRILSLVAEVEAQKSAAKVQGMVRKRRNKLETRRQVATKMHEAAEYAEERRQKRTLDTFLLALREKAPEALERRYSKTSAIDDLRKTGWPATIEIEPEYTGIHLPNTPTKDTMIDLMDRLFEVVKTETYDAHNQRGGAGAGARLGLKGLVHVKYVLQIAVKFLDIVRAMTTVTHISTALTRRLTVVGDLHGQLRDLVHVFRHNGLPSFDNPYLFNGDLVDRGPYSIEILLLLMGLALADPFAVFFNRGNHEDFAVGHHYGFVAELDAKFGVNTVEGRHLYQVLELCFANLPIAHVVDHNVFVVHGGLTDKLDSIDRLKHVDRGLHPTLATPPLKLHLTNNEHSHSTHEILKDLLWSDPILDDSLRHETKCKPNEHRGNGVVWPAGLTAAFLDKHGLGVMIRSHQCRAKGFESIHDDRCLTLFSASNYYSDAHAENDGAVIVLEPPKKAQILTYRTTTLSSPTSLSESVATLERQALDRVGATLLDHRVELVERFNQLDPESTGVVRLEDWAQAMNDIVPIKLPWAHLAHKFVDVIDTSTVKYETLLDNVEDKLVAEDDRPSSSKVLHRSRSEEIRENLHSRRHELTFLFRLLDSDSNGQLDKASLAHACDLVNRLSDDGEKPFGPHDVEQFLRQLDIDGDGTVSFNEFLNRLSATDSWRPGSDVASSTRRQYISAHSAPSHRS